MRVLKKIFSSRSGATLTNTLIGAGMLSGVAVLISQGITQQRTQSVRINAGGTCSIAIKSAMDNLKAIDNNRQGSVSWSPALEKDPATLLVVARDYDPAAIDGARFSYKVIFDSDGSNAILNAAAGPIAPANYAPGMNELPVIAPFDDAICVGNCNDENDNYNTVSRSEAASAVLTYQNLNSATSRLAYLYNIDADYCNDDLGLRIDNLGNWGDQLRMLDITQAAGLSVNPEIHARIQRVNLLTGVRDCVGAGPATPMLPIPESSGVGAGGSDVSGLEVTLTLLHGDPLNRKGCTISNNFSQSRLSSSPAGGTPVITATEPATQVNPPTALFCGAAPSAVAAGDHSTPGVDVQITESGQGAVSFCRVEFMDTNRGLPVENPYTGDVNTAPAGYEYADSGWFVCKVPTASFEAGVDVSAIDPNNLVGTVLNNAGNRATVEIHNFTRANETTIDLRLTNLPEGKFTVSTFTVDASQTASAINSSTFSVDLYRPLAATGISPLAGGVVGQFDDPAVRINEFRSMFPAVERINDLDNAVKANFHSNNKIYQCKPGEPEFELTGFEEMYVGSPGAVRWYFGPSSVTDANITLFLSYDATQVAEFNAAIPAAHPNKFHPKERIVDPFVGNRVRGPTIDNYLESGEWIAVALPRDDCGFGLGANSSRRSWVVDLEDRPTLGPADPTGTLAVEVAGGQPKLPLDRPTFNYSFNGSKQKHRVGAWAGLKQLPHLYLCETAGPSAGFPNEAPGNSDKSFYTYTELYDLYETFGVPDVGYNPASGRYDLTYNTAVVDGTLAFCNQPNFVNACVEDSSSEVGVVTVDACGRVQGDDTKYEVRGYSDGWGDINIDGDICKDIDCAPGFYCDKVGPDAGRCKTLDEVNWTSLATRNATVPYPFQNCTGRACTASVNCGVDADCVNDTGAGAVCVNSELACTTGGAAFSAPGSEIIASGATPPFSPAPSNAQGNLTIGLIATGFPHCLPNIDWEAKAQETDLENLHECSYYSSAATSCNFAEDRTNPYVQHNSNGLRGCPTAENAYFEWANTDTSDCAIFDTSSGSEIDCSVSAAETTPCTAGSPDAFCISGRTEVGGYSWVEVPATRTACTGPTSGSCSSTYSLAFVTNEDSACSGFIPVLCSGSPVTCNAANYGVTQCTSTGPMNCDIHRCRCDGVYTPGTPGSCSALDDFTSLATCDSGILNSVETVQQGSDEVQYRCELSSRTCSAPRRSCQLRNGLPPWVAQSSTHSMAFGGQCNVTPGLCDISTLTPDRSNTGSINNLACPNLDPFDPICGGTPPVCGDVEANYCSGVDFTYDIPACHGGGSLACTGSAAPDCSHLSGYSLLTDVTIAQCLLDGYTDCQPASLTCSGRTYTCGAITACRANEIQYPDIATCTSTHALINCTTIPTGPDAGQACGRGCHPKVAHQASSELACNAGEDRACRPIHGPINGVNNWCATKCSSSAGVATYPSMSICETNLGVGNCSSEVVDDSGPIVRGCGSPPGCSAPHPNKSDNLVECIVNSGSLTSCLRTVRSGSCQAYPTCLNGSTPVFLEDMLACNGSIAPLGADVSTECCKQTPTSGTPTSCSYVQNHKYFDDTTGTERSHSVFCPQVGTTTGLNCSWDVNSRVECTNATDCARVGVVIPVGSDDSPVNAGESCTSGDPTRSWNDRISGYVSTSYRANCSCIPPTPSNTSTCGPFTFGRDVSGGGGTILSLDADPSFSKANCENQCKTNCEIANVSTCKATYVDQSGNGVFACSCRGWNSSPATIAGNNGPVSPVGFEGVASCTPSVNPPPTPPQTPSYSWLYAGRTSFPNWETTDITTICLAGEESGLPCTAGDRNRTCKASASTDVLICAQEDWKWKWEAGENLGTGCSTLPEVTTWTATTPFAPDSPVGSGACVEGQISSLGFEPEGDDTGRCELYTCEYDGSAVVDPNPAPSPTTCQQYWCQASAPPPPTPGNCWAETSSVTDFDTVNPAGIPVSTCSGDCPSGVGPTTGNPCTAGETATVEWRFGTITYACQACPGNACTFSGTNTYTARSYPTRRSDSTVHYPGGYIHFEAGMERIGHSGVCGAGLPVSSITNPNTIAWYASNTGDCASMTGPKSGSGGVFATCPKTVDQYEYKVIATEQPNLDLYSGGSTGGDLYFLKVDDSADVDNASGYDSGWRDLTAGPPTEFSTIVRGESTYVTSRTTTNDCHGTLGTVDAEIHIREKANPSVVSSKNITLRMHCFGIVDDSIERR